MPVTATPTPTADQSTCGAPQLPGGAVPAPLPVSCYNQHILVPRTPHEPTTGRPILTRTMAIEIPGQQKATIEHVMRDVNGAPVDLRHCLCQAGDGSSESSESLEDADCPYVLVFRLAEYLSSCQWAFPATVVDAANGKVSVSLRPKDTAYPGIYFGEFAVVERPDPSADRNSIGLHTFACQSWGGGNDDTDEPTVGPPPDGSVVIFSNKLYIVIGRNLWNNRMTTTGPAGPPSIAEVRLHLRDTDPSESYLLDNLAFSDEEIAMCMYLPVQYWNEIPPPIGTHTTVSFPYRYHWLMAIAGHLFLIAAEQQRRNNLAYSAGGVQVNDQNKEPNYEQAAQRRLTEYRDFVKRKKAEINLESAYGEVGSAYRQLGW